jgi:hypothetical protein
MRNKQTLFCASPLPLLWYFSNFLEILAFLLIILLVIIFVVRIIRNKIEKRAVLDKTNKSFLLWFCASILFLVTAPSFSSKLYSIRLVCLATILFIVFYIAKKFKLFKVHVIYIVLTSVLLIGSIVISGLKIKKVYFGPAPDLINLENPPGIIDLGGCSDFSWY